MSWPGATLRPWLCGLAGVLILAAVLQAQNDIVAFGDSITEGPPPFDEAGRGGYPPRLQELLRTAGQSEVVVFNEGLSGERTSAALTRIDSVIEKHLAQAGTFIIMEGTNDINQVARGDISIESIVQNLEAMAAKVRGAGMDVLYSTIIPRPPWAGVDSSNRLTFDLVFRLRELTSSGPRVLAEPWEVIENRGVSIFNTHYFCCDMVGHPNAAGFQLLAEIFADKLLGNDGLAPVVSSFSKTGRASSLSAGDALSAIVHESGEGIRRADTYFTLNGRAVPTEVEGSSRRVRLFHRVAARDVGCAARITVRTEDNAVPANVRNRTVAELSVPNAKKLAGDVNGDCRVDGLDLSLLGLSFGSRRGEASYSRLADANDDGRVDGQDLARLAKNFGESSI